MAKKNKAIKYRIHPCGEQESQIDKTFGCTRKVYNEMLEVQEKLHINGGKHLSKYAAFEYMTHTLKDKYSYLKDADSHALMNSVFDLDAAYERFFKKKAGHPIFKSKREARQSYRTDMINDNIEVTDNGIKLPKLGVVKASIHRKAPEGWILKSVTVSRSPSGKYYASVLYEYEDDVKTIDPKEADIVGLDYKSDGLFEDSDGNIAGSPGYYRMYEKRLAKAQRKLSKKTGSKKGEPKSGNYLKQKRKVDRICEKIANSRKDHLHKLSTKIVNLYDAVCIEDLDMRAMSNKGFGNGKATLDNGWGMFVRMLEYKLADKGKQLVKVDRWYPSSQICSCCGHRNTDVKDLKIREWICPVCNAHHDRDHNAAVNIRSEGIRILKEMGYLKAAKAA